MKTPVRSQISDSAFVVPVSVYFGVYTFECNVDLTNKEMIDGRQQRQLYRSFQQTEAECALFYVLFERVYEGTGSINMLDVN